VALREVGALLEAKAFTRGAVARAHLTMLAQTNHISNDRVDQLLELVGLTAVAGKRAGKFRWGWVSVSVSRRRCSVIRKYCSSTNR